ncbi:hypothetical protein [Lysobacter auxotrophicus]|uniref:Uncharacterized protein n=1 Tax=Lysobacter auxotrophicus TaxID=2992573 RepID=A0ABN6ULZ5_9GAMM|nr:hypothetical protein [Lysobacter auxotrophicus]BDU17315.1 hypothetical protein LA521A_25160 [Lysobacter auxotrophicus]
MRTMTLMAALAMVAATHSIATRTAAASDTTTTTASAIHTFDLPTVRVYATVERDADAVALQEPRIHDLPPVRVQAVRDERDVADVRRTALAMRTPAARRASLAIPRGSSRRGIAPERGTPSQAEVRFDRWIALTCVIRMRLTRVWPIQHCNDGSQGAGTRMRTGVSMPVSLVERRR